MVPDNIGVVAIGRNEGQRLVECLASVKSITDNIVYVDSGSTDNSVAAAREIGALVIRLDLTRPFTAARARNEGFAAIKELRPRIRFVQFVDGDCILVQGWVDEALAFIEQSKDVAIVCGRRRERHPTASVYNQLLDIEWDTPVGETYACGGDALVRVDAFEAVGGFRPTVIAGEEPELCLRLRELGWKIWRLDAEMTRHDAAMSRLGQWWVRAVRSGYGCTEVSRLHRASRFRIWRRAKMSAVVWGGVVPALIGVGTVIHPAVLCGAVIYPLQACRIAIRKRSKSPKAWMYAVFTVAAKFAEFQGILKFYWHCWRKQTVQLIEYKK
jgi:GT2 family glycosyltransferase